MKPSLLQCFAISWAVLTSVAFISFFAFGIMMAENGQSYGLIPIVAWICITIMATLTGAICSCVSREDSDTITNQADENGNYEADVIACEQTSREQSV